MMIENSAPAHPMRTVPRYLLAKLRLSLIVALVYSRRDLLNPSRRRTASSTNNRAPALAGNDTE